MVTETTRSSGVEFDVSDLLAALYRGLGDPTRVRIVQILLEVGPTSVQDLVERLDMQQGRVSSHLACLRQCGFVVSYREGRNVFYTVADPRVGDLVRSGTEILMDNAQRVLECQVVGGG